MNALATSSYLKKMLGVGLLLSFFGAVFIYFGGFLFGTLIIEITLITLAALYIGFIIRKSQRKTGQVIAMVSFIVGSFISMYLFVSIIILGSFIISSIWLTRLFFLYKSGAQALWDAIILVAGVISAFYTLEITQSWFLALWIFFLIQTLCVFIPDISWSKFSRQKNTTNTNHSFEQAFNNAEYACDQLNNQRKSS